MLLSLVALVQWGLLSSRPSALTLYMCESHVEKPSKWLVLAGICLVVYDLLCFVTGDFLKGLAGLGAIFVVIDKAKK